MREVLDPLFEAVRQACTPAIWSRGVELTRADAVVGEPVPDDDETVAFRVATRGGMISPRVRLYPEDREWECECSSRQPACEHVAAAVIAWRQALEQGRETVAPSRHAGRVGYRFSRSSGALALERTVVAPGGDEQPLLTTLAAVATGRVDGPRFVAAQVDLTAELALGTHRRGVLAPALVARVFRALSGCSDVRLDAQPVQVSPDPVLPRLVVSDQGDGFRLTLEPDPEASEGFGNGIVRCGEVLRPRGEPKLTAREREDLLAGRSFSVDEAATLVAEVLPGLRGRVPLDVRTTRLPGTVTERPWLSIEIAREGEVLDVLAALVYGDPPRARVDGGRLVHLGGAVPQRDEHEERRLVHRAERELALVPGVRLRVEGAEAVAFNARLEAWRGSVRGTGREHFRLLAPLMPWPIVESDRFAVEFWSETAQGGKQGRADAGVVLRAWRAGESVVPLLSGGYAALPADWLARFGARVADLLAARQAEGALPRSVLPDLARLCADLDLPVAPQIESLRSRLADFSGISAAELPADLATPLRDYQREGVDWLVWLRELSLGGLLADDMGLGKTLQALCAVRGRTLVVAPTSVLFNWAAEIERHRPALGCQLYHGARRRLDPEADVTLTSYALLRLDVDALAAIDWDTVVLDEAQNIKNPESQVAQAAFRLRADYRLALTGTPVENRLDELWSQFHFINPGLLGSRGDFQERYAEPIARGDAEVAARLRARIQPFVLRRLKRQVAKELPPRTEMVLRCELAPDERQVYDAVRSAALASVVERLDAGGGVMAAFELLLRLRQAACHAALVPGQQVAGSSKIALLLETLESVRAEGHRALVFSQWTSLLDRIEPVLREADIAWLRLDGTTRDRGEVVRAFQDEGGPPVLLVSLKAGGTGLNLTAADHVFLLDPWWNPAVEDQAADRAHRIGQERPVMVYRLVATDTVEERILALQDHKRALAEAALSGTASGAALTRDDLLELLR